jgi:hypothetical protein
MENEYKVPKYYVDLYEKEVKELVEKYKGIKNKNKLFKAVDSEIKKFIKNSDVLTIINLATYAWEREMKINKDAVVNTLKSNPNFAMDENFFDYIKNSFPDPFDLLPLYSLVLLSSLLLYSVIKEINSNLLFVPEEDVE